jgi:hypothetical protein
MSADLSQPIRDAIVGESSITALLGTYLGSPAVLTRAPAPDETIEFPYILVSDDVAKAEEDGLFDLRPVVTREVTTYARNDTPEHYRLADQIAYLVRTLFHRQWRSLTVPGWRVVDIQCMGPVSTTQEDQTDGRTVSLVISLAKVRT